MHCYLSAPWLVPGRAPPWSPVTPRACTRPRPHCCSLPSYLQSCQERRREQGKRGWREVEGEEGAARGRALPGLSLLQLCKERLKVKEYFLIPQAPVLAVNGNCHKFECRLKIFSRCLSVSTARRNGISHTPDVAPCFMHVRGGARRFHTDILLRFTGGSGC